MRSIGLAVVGVAELSTLVQWGAGPALAGPALVIYGIFAPAAILVGMVIGLAFAVADYLVLWFVEVTVGFPRPRSFTSGRQGVWRR